MRRLREIWQCLFPPNHDNPCPSLAPEGAKVGDEIRQEYMNATPIADEVLDVQEHPHDEAKETRRMNRPRLNHGIRAPHDRHRALVKVLKRLPVLSTRNPVSDH